MSLGIIVLGWLELVILLVTMRLIFFLVSLVDYRAAGLLAHPEDAQWAIPDPVERSSRFWMCGEPASFGSQSEEAERYRSIGAQSRHCISFRGSRGERHG